MQTVEKTPLSNWDIQKLLEPDTKIWTYDELSKVRKLDDLFDAQNRCILLMLTRSKTVGHWVCIWRKGRVVHFFDSYGIKPDGAKQWLTANKLAELEELPDYLTQLLKASKYRVLYNTFPYQEFKPDVQTCGRWAVTRLLLKELSDAQFHALVMQSGMRPDAFVSFLTKDLEL